MDGLLKPKLKSISVLTAFCALFLLTPRTSALLDLVLTWNTNSTAPKHYLKSTSPEERAPVSKVLEIQQDIRSSPYFVQNANSHSST
ncbi:hypothetical protein CDAR_376291 [Caerostris darwini]|uniref:Uncharacterized protein n=1 Tax=Caerostris darwini TaxID=1538125 RepID=A0AAV4QNC6_9ARAC|nr:hypothetical protein CDAR_376291 [Caerostris darwini]